MEVRSGLARHYEMLECVWLSHLLERAVPARQSIRKEIHSRAT